MVTGATTALLTLLLGNTYHARNIVASVLVMIWAARIAGTSQSNKPPQLKALCLKHSGLV